MRVQFVFLFARRRLASNMDEAFGPSQRRRPFPRIGLRTPRPTTLIRNGAVKLGRPEVSAQTDDQRLTRTAPSHR
jgi:hypothetical protein